MPVQNTADEGRNEGDTGFGTSHSLTKTEQESEVTVDLFITLEFTGSLDTLPGRCDFNENAFLGNANGLIKFDQVSGLHRRRSHVQRLWKKEIGATYGP